MRIPTPTQSQSQTQTQTQTSFFGDLSGDRKMTLATSNCTPVRIWTQWGIEITVLWSGDSNMSLGVKIPTHTHTREDSDSDANSDLPVPLRFIVLSPTRTLEDPTNTLLHHEQ